MNRLPTSGFIRLHQIIGDKNSDPPIPPMIPVGKTTWWQGVKSGIYPAPYKISPGISAWKVEDIEELLNKLGEEI